MQSIISNALITNKNKPKVTSVTGKVNKTNIGFTNKFSNPNTIATTIEVAKLSTETPSIKFAINVTKIAVTNNLTIKYIEKNLFVTILQ